MRTVLGSVKYVMCTPPIESTAIELPSAGLATEVVLQLDAIVQLLEQVEYQTVILLAISQNATCTVPSAPVETFGQQIIAADSSNVPKLQFARTVQFDAHVAY